MNDLFSTYPVEEAKRITALIAGFRKGSLTESEHNELDDWVEANHENMQIFEKLTDPDNI